MSLETSVERLELRLAEPFTIARGSRETAETVVVRIDDGEHVGVGGAAPSARYGETTDTVGAALPDLLRVVRDVDDPLHLQRIERRLAEVGGGDAAARCAVEVALHDLVGKRLGLPLHRYFGLDPAEAAASSYTIGIADTDRMAERARAAVDSGFDILKIKLGTDRDGEIVAAVREAAPDATIRVDANEAWSPPEAVDAIGTLAASDIEFVEQPVPASDPDGLRFVYERSALPIAADESCVTPADLPAVADRCDIVNLKLMKTGGLREATRMIHVARAHGLDVMLGCMIESNASIAAACHLAPLVDYADLDGSLLLAHDPYAGVPMTTGEIDLGAADRPGSGARRSAE